MRKLRTIEMQRLSVDEFKRAEKLPLVVVLDNVRSAYNVGSIFRTSDAFLIEKIIICGISPCPPEVEIHKTAIGAENSVDWEYYENALDAVDYLHSNNYKVIAIEQVEGSSSLDKYYNISLNEKYAIVLGNEVKGVTQEVVDMCDDCIEIRQYGTKHSLNVSVAAGIVLHHFSSQFHIINGL